MRHTAILNVVGLTGNLIGEHTPFLSQWSENAPIRSIEPVLPAVTCSAQATYLTGCTAFRSRHRRQRLVLP